MKLADFQITSTLGFVAVCFTVATGASMLGLIVIAQLFGAKLDASYLPWADKWIDFLTWLLAFVVLGVVGKRATAKPEVIDAETRQAAVTGSVPPPTPDNPSKTPVANSVVSRLAGGTPVRVRPLEEPEPGTPMPHGEMGE